jgi:hypothetical protein
MPVVQGVKEKVHLPIYDSLTVEPEKQLRAVENSSTLKFFINVQGKTKLETNLQSASLLPHYNTFEARAMRVVISDLPPEFPASLQAEDTGLFVTDEDDNGVFLDETEKIGVVEVLPIGQKNVVVSEDGFDVTKIKARVLADIEVGLDRLVELLSEARDSEDGFAALAADEEGVSLTPGNINAETVADFGGVIFLSVSTLEGYISELPEKEQPPKEQLRPNNGAGTLIGKLIYNTVTTFYVGEKIMIQMPTWFFPAGAGPYSEAGRFTTHGEPSPTATFRFAEPIFIDRQQNFRVEIEIPDTDVLKDIQKIYGPLFIWVVLDGYMTRDVQ